MKKLTLLSSALLAGIVIASPAVFADPGHGNGKQNNAWKNQQKELRQYQHRNDTDRHDDNKKVFQKDGRYYDSRTGQYLTKSQYNQLPPGLQKNVARGKAVPPGWAKKLDSRYYSVNQYNGRNVYVLNSDAYRNATILSRPRPGEVRVRVDNRVLDIIEATRVILNVL